MYVRLKIFEKKLKGEYQPPIFSYEITGNTAIKILIISLVSDFYSKKTLIKIKEILDTEDN